MYGVEKVLLLNKLFATLMCACQPTKGAAGTNSGRSKTYLGTIGCVGGCIKPPPINTSEKHSKKQKLLKKGGRGHPTHAPKKDWWTSSSNEMESNSTNPRSSQRNASAVSTPNHQQESRGTTNNTTNTAFVNHALMLWNERRREWIGNRPRHRVVQPREPVISWSTTYEDLLATSRPFPQPVPLPEMVDFLVDVWEQEGLYE